jgi:mRNA (2'-O-methyladenosine-N6-)-methyltransferase
MLGNAEMLLNATEANDQELQQLVRQKDDLLARISILEAEILDLEAQSTEWKSENGVEPLEQSCKTAQDAVDRILSFQFQSREILSRKLPSAGAKISMSAVTVPPFCIPIRADVLNFDWKTLFKAVEFDVIVMDPPWQLATNQPTRGVAIAYQQLPDLLIEDLPIGKLSTNGFIFIWVINNKYVKALELMQRWGYRHVDDVTWVKQTVNRRLAKGHGYYLQHAKETCLVGVKGKPVHASNVASDVIYAERRGQSQKPEELYEMIEALVPNGRYLEVFGRRNNLRNFWTTLGNEL